MNSGSILFLNWRGEPELKQSEPDAGASVESGSALGARQFETPVGSPANQQTFKVPVTLVAFSERKRGVAGGMGAFAPISSPWFSTIPPVWPFEPWLDLVKKSLHQNGSEFIKSALARNLGT